MRFDWVTHNIPVRHSEQHSYNFLLTFLLLFSFLQLSLTIFLLSSYCYGFYNKWLKKMNKCRKKQKLLWYVPTVTYQYQMYKNASKCRQLAGCFNSKTINKEHIIIAIVYLIIWHPLQGFSSQYRWTLSWPSPDMKALLLFQSRTSLPSI